MASEIGHIVIQDCGCIAIPEEIAGALGMGPGTKLKLDVDAAARSIRLTAPADGRMGEIPMLAACPIKS
jgi:hypothetical protein